MPTDNEGEDEETDEPEEEKPARPAPSTPLFPFFGTSPFLSTPILTIMDVAGEELKRKIKTSLEEYQDSEETEDTADLAKSLSEEGVATLIQYFYPSCLGFFLFPSEYLFVIASPFYFKTSVHTLQYLPFVASSPFVPDRSCRRRLRARSVTARSSPSSSPHSSTRTRSSPPSTSSSRAPHFLPCLITLPYLKYFLL